MTRLEQWLARRGKMLRRLERQWNARPRGHKQWVSDDVVYEGPQHGGGQWQMKGLLLRPQLKASTLKRQIKPYNPRHFCHRVGDVGKWNPPHYKSDLSPFDPGNSKSHFRFRVNQTHLRNVQWREHKNGRNGGAGYKGYVAWVYWKKRGVWPFWDPQHRTPVDPVTLGPDDEW